VELALAIGFGSNWQKNSSSLRVAIFCQINATQQKTHKFLQCVHWLASGKKKPQASHWQAIGFPVASHWLSSGKPMAFHWQAIGFPVTNHWLSSGKPLACHLQKLSELKKKTIYVPFLNSHS
jgi:hypothetical protein